tara:strand:- start:931 stop:1227 length:297 start_codon:yes stop_codon:yes gene_type:complete
MKQQQMIEMIQKHHPEMTETEIRIYLNKALDEFCEQSKILKGQQEFTTTTNKRYYELNDLDSDSSETDQHKFIDVDRVDYDDFQISRLQEPPQKYSST